MTNEISEEAKKALADVSRRKAIDLLQRDGSCSMDAVRRRVLVIAAEWNIPPAEYAKLMYKRVSTRHAMAFAEKHKISLDWLLCGDLKGLQRMTREAKAEPPEMTEAQRKEVTQLFLALSPRMQTVALGCMRELMTRGLSNG
jgi:hypothetical protein